MAGEPSIGEVVRRLEDVRADLKDDLAAMARRLDSKVSTDVLALQQQAQDERTAALAARVVAMEESARERDRQRASDRRLILTALVTPLLLLLLEVYLTARGAR